MKGPIPAATLALALALDLPAGARAQPIAPAPRPSPRLEAFYEIPVASPHELRRINADNASIAGIRIGDTFTHLIRTLGKPRGKRVERAAGAVHHTVLRFDDVLVRVDADQRISRIKVMASGAWIMRNAMRALMTNFSERTLRQVLGLKFRRKLERVYVWPISPTNFMQDTHRDRLLARVRRYYGLATLEEAGKKIIRAWDTVYIYEKRGLRVRVYSNIPVAGRFKADFILLKPPPAPGGGG
ncbi:MAG: hypothetical protein ACE5FC_02315 [Myxococcota bacterium]